ncbi:MAG TPA: hypothetical protein VFP43_04060 [Mesorhizobium sp.]|nr:hypothetical protein [Mesorhizobium sp.]
MATELERLKNEVLAITRDVLQRRDSARIIKMTTDRADVRGLLNEYRQFVAECERILARNGLTLGGGALELVRSAWSDVLIKSSGLLPDHRDRRPQYTGMPR